MVSTASRVTRPSIGVLSGTTASGKTELALSWAEKQKGRLEIINADSLLVYRGFDIGTAKPEASARARVPHHLIDVRDPDQPFTAGDFVREVDRLIPEIHARGNRALIVGGTAFYLKALFFGLWDAPAANHKIRTQLESQSSPDLYERLREADPVSALRIGVNDRYRLVRALELIELTGKTPTALKAEQPQTPHPRFELWVIDRKPGELESRIHLRAAAMLERGLVEEAQTLSQRYPSARPLQSVGYQQCLDYVDHKKPAGRKIAPGLDGLQSEIELATRQLVKKQRTWFRAQRHAQHFLLDDERSSVDQRFEAIYGESSKAAKVRGADR